MPDYNGTAGRIVHNYAECGFLDLCDYLAKVEDFEQWLSERGL